MITGLFAGITWALETVILGIAISMSPMNATKQTVLIAPFVATFLHDSFSAVFTLVFNVVRGDFKKIRNVFKSNDFKWLILSSSIGGPIGMTGYVLAVNYMGSSMGAVASAVYPAIGTILAFAFLKEKVNWYQWIFLFFTLLGVYGISYSPTVNIKNFELGLLGVLLCSFGWGIEAVILAKCFKTSKIKTEYALLIRQTTSAMVYGIIILPIINGWKFTCSLFVNKNSVLLTLIATAALCATASYLFYYKAIIKTGAAKAMALNITYTAWSILFSVILTKDTSVLNPLTLICSIVVVVCGIFSATDVKSFLYKK